MVDADELAGAEALEVVIGIRVHCSQSLIGNREATSGLEFR
jgi:hypothetical protein